MEQFNILTKEETLQYLADHKAEFYNGTMHEIDIEFYINIHKEIYGYKPR